MKLAAANQAIEALQAQLQQERQVRIAAEPALSAPAVPAIDSEMAGPPSDQPVKPKRRRPPGKRDTAALRKAQAVDQEPVRWWPDGWAPPR